VKRLAADTAELVALAEAGRYPELETRARAMLLRHPTFAAAHTALAMARFANGLERNVAACRRAIALDPTRGRPHQDLGLALVGLGRREEALASLGRAVELDPGLTDAHIHLGDALRALGRVQEAATSYRRALDLRPEDAELHAKLGEALLAGWRSDEAAASCRRALELNPDHVDAHYTLGNALLDLSRWEEAEACYRRVLERQPQHAEAANNLGCTLRLQRRGVEAAACARRALKIKPTLAASHLLLAELHADAGRFVEAEASFKRALAIDPGAAPAWAGLVAVRKMTAVDTDWLAGAERVLANGIEVRHEVPLRYAMGKYFDDLQEFERAFDHYRRANDLAKSCRAPHDRELLTRDVGILIDSYDADWVRRVQSTATSTRPVFIVGMPRSGTSLADQILCSHGAVAGIGEQLFWNTVSGTQDATTLGQDGGRLLHALADDYLALLAQAPAAARRVIDKLPGNFFTLGMIHAALPNARIIHLTRDSVDTCLSIYFQHFNLSHPYANDLDDLAHYYGEYRRVMKHWRALIPAQALLDVPYEGLVADPEGWSRRMVEFLGLEWDARCLDFDQTARPVQTASRWQVRQKIVGSSERWRHYERFAGPLLALREAAVDAAAVTAG
jgi:tetratricopeptide (TPR) repeat protein